MTIFEQCGLGNMIQILLTLSTGQNNMLINAYFANERLTVRLGTNDPFSLRLTKVENAYVLVIKTEYQLN